ncbi:MAG TPA: hypothetical protein VFI84_03970 [Candidatus Saccharimonadales bacterium]|nr:hypothetical protein [Candidatus Saccharimonadales bacterium]
MSLNILPKFSSKRSEQHRAELYRKLLRQEAKIGGELFGPIPPGHRREFFCLDRYTWVWHEEWTDQNGQHQSITTRYTIRPDGILKSQGEQSYQRLSEDELRNLYRAAKLYRQRVRSVYQRMLQAA